MTTVVAHCIYCGEAFGPSAGEGDHVLPRALGEFDGAIIYRGACSGCNNDLSTLEEELLRTAPEAVLRRYAGAAQNRRGKPVGWQAASGVRPPRFVIRHHDHEELVKADPEIAGRALPVDQLAIVQKDNQTIHIPLFPSMSANALRRKIAEQGVTTDNVSRIHWHANDETAETYKSLLKVIWPNFRHEELPSTPAGIHRVPVRIECRFTVKYYRAIAKIAFHYFLANSRCGFTGHEQCFEPVRRFIMEGGEHEQFFEAQKPRVALPVGKLPNGSALLPGRWTHLLCCFESLESVVVGVYTLFGPEHPPSPHFVTLLHRPSPLALLQHNYGHVYIYGNPALGDDRDAFVEEVAIGRIM